MSNLPPVLRSAGLMTVCALAITQLTLYSNHRSATNIVDGRGARLIGFFDGLRAHPNLGKLAAKERSIDHLPACAREKKDWTGRLLSFIWEETVVHAQTDCPMGDESSCNTYTYPYPYPCGGLCCDGEPPCGSYWASVSDMDNANVGTSNDGSLGCNITGCTCNQTQCVVT